ncbi:MAG: hypothetical protein R3B13_34110 [Polyangiaceae bacterium]
MRRLLSCLALFALGAVATACGSENCSQRTSDHEEAIDGLQSACVTAAEGGCASDYCVSQCPRLTGTNNASFSLEGCSPLSPTRLLCRYTLATEWCE